MKTVTRKDIVNLGYSKYYADKIFNAGKKLLVKKGYTFYNNIRIKRIPVSAVEEILRISLEE